MIKTIDSETVEITLEKQCMICGEVKPAGTRIAKVAFLMDQEKEEKKSTSHGYCKPCGEKVIADIRRKK